MGVRTLWGDDQGPGSPVGSTPRAISHQSVSGVAPWLHQLVPFDHGMRWQAYFFTGLVAGFYYDNLRGWWAARPRRLPFFFVVFGAAYMLFQRYQTGIMRRLNWLLEPLGANSLYVYIWQGAFAFALPFLMLPKNVLVNSIVPIIVILALWWLVKRRVLFGIIPR